MMIRTLLLFSFLHFTLSQVKSQDMLFNISYDTTIVTGAERVNSYLNLLKGKRVAIVANQTSSIKQTHIVDSLLSLGVDIKKVFSPEHGFRGNASAGELVKSSMDVKTGLPLVSLYGKNKKPSALQLADIDIVIFDIQDVGARFYTYISTMHYVMEACAENNKKMLILDRPNPNGYYVDGPILKKEFKSFVGMHPIPVVHGLTVGELAFMINGEGWLKGGVKCDFKVIKCEKYSHSDYYKLPIAPSPNLPNMSSVYLYPSICFFEGTSVSVGRGTDLPFQVIGSPYLPKTSYSFTPSPNLGSKNPKYKGIECNGYDLNIFGLLYIRNTKKLYLHWLIGLNEKTKGKEFITRASFFDLLAGTNQLRQQVIKGESIKTIQESWSSDLDEYMKMRGQYLIYEDF
ncbi:DUF1343 domain-containing protein [Flavobacteriales bacterium]|nr:DUF1343 domain-containing protein [Flavobacteriales bacterium]